jgi:hypothetical protein
MPSPSRGTKRRHSATEKNLEAARAAAAARNATRKAKANAAIQAMMQRARSMTPPRKGGGRKLRRTSKKSWPFSLF